MVEKKKGRPSASQMAEYKNTTILKRALEIAGNPEGTSQVFILHAMDRLTHPQYLAAQKVTEVYRRWHQLAELRPNPKSASLQPGTGRGESKTLEAAYVQETRDMWERLERCISQVRKEERTLLFRLCVENMAVTMYELRTTLYRLLNIISVEFDLGPEPVRSTALPATRSKPRVTRNEKFEQGLYATLKVGRLSGPQAPPPLTDAQAAEISAKQDAQALAQATS